MGTKATLKIVESVVGGAAKDYEHGKLGDALAMVLSAEAGLADVKKSIASEVLAKGIDESLREAFGDPASKMDSILSSIPTNKENA